MSDRELRDNLVKQYYDIDKKISPEDSSQAPDTTTRIKLLGEQNKIIDDYAVCLPHIILSVCPFCNKPLKKVFDPYGLNGHWWVVEPIVNFAEPETCEHFKVLQGALNLNGRTPSEVCEKITPGPEVPFVIPDLMNLPGMLAVIGKMTLEHGDLAYPIAYFSDKEIDPAMLHQSWCRDTYWFKNKSGKDSWTICNSLYDFELKPYVDKKSLRWVDLENSTNKVLTVEDQECPFIDLPGDRENQMLAAGRRELAGLPTGEAVNPFE